MPEAVSHNIKPTSAPQATLPRARVKRFAAFVWATLAYNVLVVLWGAFVRATNSGAGCGSHYPLCNGEVVPLNPAVETLIEFSHRVTSGLALLLIIWLVVWARKVYRRGHAVRRAIHFTLFFTLTEALIGAGLVVFELVADDASIARALSLAVHLVNTFLLLGALALAAWWASQSSGVDDRDGARRQGVTWRGQGIIGFVFAATLGAMLLLGVSGAIAALGDTLFPAASLAEGWRHDFSPTAHTLVRLRLLHPAFAGVATLLLAWAAWLALRRAGEDNMPDAARTKRSAYLLLLTMLVQLAAGGVNVLLLAPVWMQIVHLLLADLVWIQFVVLTATVLAPRVSPATSVAHDEQLTQRARLELARTQSAS